MALLDPLLKNVAELSEGAGDERLRPVVVTLAPPHAVGWARGVLEGLPRWAVVHAYEDRLLIHATRTSRFWKFVDDVHLGFEEHPRGCRITARSHSRVGKGDLGQNARNLRALTRALRDAEADRVARLKGAATS